VEYIRLQYQDSASAMPEERWFELNQNAAVKRTIHICDTRAVNSSIAIQSHRQAAFADWAYTSDDPCLFANAYAASADLVQEWTRKGFIQLPATAADFNKTFMSATPAI